MESLVVSVFLKLEMTINLSSSFVKKSSSFYYGCFWEYELALGIRLNIFQKFSYWSLDLVSSNLPLRWWAIEIGLF